jgi:hypothetical protein
MKGFGHMMSIGADRVAILFAFCDSIAAKCQTTWQGMLQQALAEYLFGNQYNYLANLFP